MKQPSQTHLLLIPSFDTGPIVIDVVRNTLKQWQPVWVVVDGSRDGSGEALDLLANSEPHLRILHHATNRGKGSAIFTGIQLAAKKGFTHVLTMDADGQHPCDSIMDFMTLSSKHPEQLILGDPIFGDNAPAVRIHGRKISNFWVNLETLWVGINDSLFGFRVYPLAALKSIMESNRYARRFDFDAEVVVRLSWQGIPIKNKPVPVRYLTKTEGGVSKFQYFRDNLLLIWMHIRLFLGFVTRFPVLVYRRLTHGSAG